MKNNNITYGKQFIEKNDIKIVEKALRGNLLTTGNYVDELERKFRTYFNSKYVLSCSSGTAALHLSFISLGIKPGDNIIVPAINFIATANILKMMGANIYLCDIDLKTFQISNATLHKCIQNNKLRKVKAVILTFMAGLPSIDKNIIKLKKKYKFHLIEDACHAMGSSYKINGKIYKVGCAKHSDISTFSLHPVKTITSGEGGLISTNNRKLYEKMKLARSHGIIRKNIYWDYEIHSPGLNYRLSDINCALAISQLKKIKKFLTKREKIAKLYNKSFEDFSDILITPQIKNDLILSWHLYIVRINFTKLKISKNQFIKILNKKKIFPQVHYIPSYRFKAFKNINKKNFKYSEVYYEQCLSLPIYYNLKSSEQNYVIKNIKKLFKKYIKH